MAADMPPLVFSKWVSWEDLWSGNDAGLKATLDRQGCYAVGRFDRKPGTERADVVDDHVIYIGETHARRRSLRQRLTEFGTSAGFFGQQAPGHYAAWAYPDCFPDDKQKGRTDSKHVFVSLCPIGSDASPACRRIEPLVVEAQVLWQFAKRHRRLPELNNLGRHAAPEAPTVSDQVFEALLNGQRNPQAASTAADEALRLLATALGYSARARVHQSTHGHWSGAERLLGKATWLWVGWRNQGTPAVGIDVYWEGEPWFGIDKEIEGQGPVTGRAQFQGVLAALWAEWFA